jgi:hypothetical protein
LKLISSESYFEQANVENIKVLHLQSQCKVNVEVTPILSGCAFPTGWQHCQQCTDDKER